MENKRYDPARRVDGASCPSWIFRISLCLVWLFGGGNLERYLSSLDHGILGSEGVLGLT